MKSVISSRDVTKALDVLDDYMVTKAIHLDLGLLHNCILLHKVVLVVVANRINNNKLPEACRFTALKDLSAVYCASLPRYNMNFSKFLRISKLARQLLKRVNK